MNDYMIRAVGANGQIRAFAATTKEMVEQARVNHQTSPIATAALGRLLTAGAMMGSMMKNEKDLLTLKIKGDGPIRGLTVTADSQGRVKGYAQVPDVMLPPKNGKLDVGGAVGNGMLSVIKDMGLKEPYTGQTILQTGEIADDLTYYFTASEQIPSAVGLGVLMEKDNTVKYAGGFIIQVMPFVDDEVVSQLEANIASIPPVTTMLEQGKSPEEMLEVIMGTLELDITDQMPVEFFCNCGKERIEKAIVSIGRDDIQEMIDAGEPIEVKCHFCNTAYEFNIDELKDIIKRSK